MTDIRLQLTDIVKEFPDRSGSGKARAVDGVSLNIRTGEFLTLLGPSGCGKTTTLRLIAGFEMLTSGKILLDGEDITQQPPNKRDMALVFQNYALFPHMNVYENVAYGLETRGMARKDIMHKVQEVINLMGLQGLENRRPNQLSGGQQQRVALARSLVMEPRILLFDEPLSNLDAKLRVQMRSEIHRLQRRLNITSVYVTHDQIEAMALSDRIVVMNKGKIEQIGSPDEIYRTPATRFVADFIGRANFLPVEVLSNQGQKLQARVLEQVCDTDISFTYQSGMKLTALLRPEILMLKQDASLPQVLVEQAMYLGSEIEYIVQYRDQKLTVVQQDARATSIFPEGSTVGLGVLTEAVHMIPN